MKKQDFVWFVLFVLAVINLFKPNLGFTPLNGAESFGFNLIPLIIYAGGVYFIYRFIKIKKEKNSNK